MEFENREVQPHTFLRAVGVPNIDQALLFLHLPIQTSGISVSLAFDRLNANRGYHPRNNEIPDLF